MDDNDVTNEIAGLWPLLTPRQRDVVSDVITGFRSVRTDSSERLLLDFLRRARQNPKLVGSNTDLRPCGCLDGFRPVSDDGRSLTVERCRICSDDIDPTTFPETIYN